MNLGIGLGITNYQGVPTVPLDPDAVIAALFGSGEEGAWYDPSDLSTVWQDAAGTTPATAGDPVGRIDDKSGNGNHATQSTSTARPTLQTSGGLYYLDFDGVDDWMRAILASNQAQPNTLAVAVKLDLASDTSYIVDGYGSERNLLYQPSTNLSLYAGTTLSSPSATGTSERVFLGYFNTTSSEIRVDGVQKATGNAGSALWGGITLGGSSASPPSGAAMTDGRIYGFVGVNRTLTAGEISDVEAYLAAKSGVTL